MFSADLSWAEPDMEKVGERRERKARERRGTASSIKTTTSSRSSISADREMWWTSGLKKAKCIHPNILRPKSRRSISSQKTAQSTPQELELKLPYSLKDPVSQPYWTYATTLSSTLPSGAPFDLAVLEVPELEGDTSSGRMNSTEARFSPERRLEVKTPVRGEIVEEMGRQPQKSLGLFVTGRTSASSSATGREDFVPTLSLDFPNKEKMRPRPILIDDTLSSEALKLHDATQKATTAEEVKGPLPETIHSERRTLECPPLSQWECLSPRRIPTEMQLQSKPATNKAAVARSSTLELTRFQRFIHRMESAGPGVVLDRLKEEWQDSPDDEVNEELALEKQLWVLTGFQMQNLGKFRVTPKPTCETGRILELYGNLSEVFQLSAMYPHQMVHFLTTRPKRPVTLPSNVSYLTVRDSGTVPLPYPGDYFSHIRTSTLPSLVPSSKLPELFRESYKLLAPGGLLEMRLMDAAPVRKTSGPLMRMWIEDRLSVNLERLFRCSKPCLLVPDWLSDAGFDLVTPDDESKVTLPCAFDNTLSDVGKELSTIIGRALWKDLWGGFVDNVPDQSKWWWEDKDIMRECLDSQTVFECRVIFAYKR